jgi:hypothetical protein
VLEGSPWYAGLRTVLPLFLCSIQLIVIPLAAFTKGHIQEISADFVALFGLLGAILGTVGAAQNYTYYPVLSFTNMVSGFTHCIAGFASLYVLIAGVATLQRRHYIGTFGLLFGFCGAALAANDAKKNPVDVYSYRDITNVRKGKYAGLKETLILELSNGKCVSFVPASKKSDPDDLVRLIEPYL